MQELSREASSGSGVVRVVGSGPVKVGEVVWDTLCMFIDIAMVLGGRTDTHMFCVDGGYRVANHGQRVQAWLEEVHWEHWSAGRVLDYSGRMLEVGLGAKCV